MYFSEELLNEALRSPNHKTCFSFDLKCLCGILTLPRHFTHPVQFQPGHTKIAGHFRAKLKYVLWLGDLKASLSCSSKKLIHITPCIFQMF